jgi:hypothetical protein
MNTIPSPFIEKLMIAEVIKKFSTFIEPEGLLLPSKDIGSHLSQLNRG